MLNYVESMVRNDVEKEKQIEYPVIAKKSKNKNNRYLKEIGGEAELDDLSVCDIRTTRALK